MPDTIKIGERIKALRLKRGLSQKALGELCIPKIDASHIRKIESGKTQPTTETLGRIQRALETSIIAEYLEPDPNEPTFADHLMLQFCDVYNPRNKATNGHSYCEIWQDNERYLVEQSKLDDFCDRAIRHLQIEFNALIEKENEFVLQYKKYEFPRFKEDLSDGNE